MDKTDKIIMPDSPEAAKLVTVTGWASRDGRFFGNDDQAEQVARYAGCTHVFCGTCGAPADKDWTACADCRAKAAAARHAARKRAEWDGEVMLYSERMERFYAGDDVEDALYDEGLTFDEMEFLICEPNKVRPLEFDDWDDDLPDDADGELPAALQDAVDAFNAATKDVVLSWSPTEIVATWADAPKPEGETDGEG